MAKALLITGATGKQGGSVIDAILKANTDFEILALTRNAQSASAQKLQAKSPKVKLITGDLDAIDDVFQKAKQATKLPIWGVFSVQVSRPAHSFTGQNSLLSQGGNRQRSKCTIRRKAGQSPDRRSHQERRQALCLLFHRPRR